MDHFDTEHLNKDSAAATLAQWQDRAAVMRDAMPTPGVARPDQVATLTGLEVFDAMFRGELPYPPIAQTLDFTIAHWSRGRADFLGTPRFAHYNPLGSVHGGWIATLLDSAVGCAVHTTLAPGKMYTTIELKVNYVRAVTDGVPMLLSAARVIHVGARIATADGRLLGPDGTLYAHATTTCLIFDPPVKP